MRSQPGLWTCPACGRGFANPNQSHACGRHDLEHHFRGKPPEIRRLYERFLAELERIGPVTVLPQKTRIAFQVRMSFAQVTPKQGRLDGHFVLAEPHEGPPVRRIQTISLRNHVHEFRIADEADFTPRFAELMRAAYAVGEQKHLRP